MLDKTESHNRSELIARVAARFHRPTRNRYKARTTLSGFSTIVGVWTECYARAMIHFPRKHPGAAIVAAAIGGLFGAWFKLGWEVPWPPREVGRIPEPMILVSLFTHVPTPGVGLVRDSLRL